MYTLRKLAPLSLSLSFDFALKLNVILLTIYISILLRLGHLVKSTPWLKGDTKLNHELTYHGKRKFTKLRVLGIFWPKNILLVCPHQYWSLTLFHVKTLLHAWRETINLSVRSRLERRCKRLTFGVLKIVTIKLHSMAKEQVCILIDL